MADKIIKETGRYFKAQCSFLVITLRHVRIAAGVRKKISLRNKVRFKPQKYFGYKGGLARRWTKLLSSVLSPLLSRKKPVKREGSIQIGDHSSR